MLFVHFEVILNLSQFPDFLSTFLKYVKTIILSSLRQHNDMILTNNVMSPEVTHSVSIPPTRHVVELKGERPEVAG